MLLSFRVIYRALTQIQAMSEGGGHMGTGNRLLYCDGFRSAAAFPDTRLIRFRSARKMANISLISEPIKEIATSQLLLRVSRT
jgi:hypothetical protein